MKLATLLLALLLLTPGYAALPGADLLSGVIMKALDRDYDGKLDAAEWKDGTDDGFVEIDHDLDGFDTSAEIQTLSEPLSDDVGKLGASLCVTLIEKMFMTLDTDGDHRISKAEYEAGTTAIFQRLDTNHDGTLTKPELNELPTALLKGKN